MKKSTGIKVGVLLVLAGIGLFYSLGRVDLETAASPVNGGRAFETLEELVGIGPRVPGTPGSVAAQEVIRRELKRAMLKVEEHGFKALTPLGQRDMKNIVGVVEGTKPGVIILSGHYDTKYLPEFEFVGANDSGSSTALLLDLARVYGASREGYTIWLCFFDGEEAFEEWSATDSLYGSREFVAKLQADGTLPRIKALVNIDMIGDCKLEINRDPDSPEWLKDAIWSCARELGYGSHFGYVAESIEDDHVPFRRAGVPAINLIDFRYGGGRYAHERNWHTSNDTLDKVCPESLKIVGDVLYHALPRIETYLQQSDTQ